jgi:hypothetical protein
MTSGFGVDGAADGSSGTSSADIRKIYGGLFTPGIISGCKVTTSASAMSYTVASGVVAIKSATAEIILAPVATTTVATAAAPSTGSRTDIVYVQQRYPSVEGDANIVVGVGTTLPARAVELRRFVVGAGDLNTNATVATGGVNYSIPYGASLGVLHSWQNTYSGPLSTSLIREGQGSITVPTDRRLKFSVNALLYANAASGFDNSKYTEHYFLPNIDGGDMVIFTTPGLHQAWGQYYWEHSINVSAGTHTVNLGSGRMVGPGQACTFYGVSSGFGRTGIRFTVTDEGPVV